MRALEYVILFTLVSGASVFVAFYVDNLSRIALEQDLATMAGAAASGVASQLKDVLAVAGEPYVVNFTYVLFTPTGFPTLDAFTYNLTLYTWDGAYRGVLAVHFGLQGYRGNGYAQASAVASVGNATELGQVSGVSILVRNTTAYVQPSGPCSVLLRGYRWVNLTRPGCRAYLVPMSNATVLVLKR